MTEQNPHTGNGGFEHADIGPRHVFGFLIVLAVVLVLVYYVVDGMYAYLDRYQRTHQAPTNPLKQNIEVDTRDTNRARVAERISRTFPQPQLETDERTEINDFRMHEEEQLNSYGWVDQSAGVVHIPIERAMQLLAERGLPVRPQEQAKPAVPAHAKPATTEKAASAALLKNQ